MNAMTSTRSPMSGMTLRVRFIRIDGVPRCLTDRAEEEFIPQFTRAASFKRLLGRPRLDFFRRHPIERWRWDVQKAEHQVDLATVVGFVLDHGPQPLPGGDRSAGWGEAFSFKVRIRQRPENCLRFHPQTIQESHNRLEALGKVATASRVAAGASRHRLCVHIALDCSEMPHEVAEGELAGMRAPFDLVRRNTSHDAARTAANGSPIVEE